jgi:hypothetical protein
VLVEPTQIKLHLPLVCCLELADLQLHRHQPPQLAVIEQQVQVEILVVDLDAFLPG